jgi:hypothetical protein
MKNIIALIILFSSITFSQSWWTWYGEDASFNPSDIDGLILHLDASVVSSITTSDSLVSVWADLSGSNNATNTTVVEQPVYKLTGLNSLPTIQYKYDVVADNRDYHYLPDFISSLTSGEIFYVTKTLNDPTANRDILGIALMDSGSSTNYYPFTDGGVYMAFLCTARKTCGNPALDLTTPHILNMRSASNSWTLDINITQQYTTATNTVLATKVPKIGGRGVGASYDGFISEVIMFNRVLTATERTQVKNYLKPKWQLVY